MIGTKTKSDIYKYTSLMYKNIEKIATYTPLFISLLLVIEKITCLYRIVSYGGHF